MAGKLPRRVLLGAMLTMATSRLAFADANQSSAKMRIEISFGDHVFPASLHGNPSAWDLLSLLPLDLTIEDYSNNEKIAYLPRKLTEEGSGSFGNEAPGDLCYYAPWGNLVFFYAAYHYSQGLIRLGRLEGGIEPLLTRGKFPLHVKAIG